MKSRVSYSSVESITERMEHILTISDFSRRTGEWLVKRETLKSSAFSLTHPAKRDLNLEFQLYVKFERLDVFDPHDGVLLQTNQLFMSVRTVLNCREKGRICAFNLHGRSRFSILNDLNIPVHECVDDQMHSKVPVNIWEVSQFILLADIEDPSKELLCEDGSLRLRCKLTLNFGDRVVSHEFSPEHETLDKRHFVGRRLSRITFPDLYLIAGDQRFACHKHMLASCSDVMQAMFSLDKSVEATTNEVVIADVEPEIVEKILEFVYTDRVENWSGASIKLIYAADKYNISNLKILAIQTATKEINVLNAGEYLLHGDRVFSRPLKEAAMTFILGNLQKVRATDGWKEVAKHHGTLVDEVLGELL